MMNTNMLLIAGLVALVQTPCKPLSAAEVEANAPSIQPVSTPGTQAEVEDTIAELRTRYAPYLRSLPKPLSLRTRQSLNGTWRWCDEAKPDGAVPNWFAVDFDDSAWQETTIPEWRFGKWKGRALRYRKRFSVDAPPAGKRMFLVFGGVDWEAQVYLNGKPLGSHRVYYEPFRFDVTGVLQKDNVLAVRVTSGQEHGEPLAYWSLFPWVKVRRGRESRYGQGEPMELGAPGSGLGGDGCGIHREVYLETGGPAYVKRLLVRGSPVAEQAHLKVAVEAAGLDGLTAHVELIPENFTGETYRAQRVVRAAEDTALEMSVPMPDGRLWTPETPYLYRCRVILRQGDTMIDSRDALFGYRSFGMVSKMRPVDDLPVGMFLLNGKPCYLRGTNIHGLNALWYAGQSERIVDILLMLKAGHFNMVRACQHVQYPEVRELQDRLGIMSQQDQGGKDPRGGRKNFNNEHHIDAAAALARVCYNNPGVVLISYANETKLDPTDLLQATLAIDPERIVKPVCGGPHGSGARPRPGRRGYPKLSDELWANVIDDFHPYWGWYGKWRDSKADEWQANTQWWCRVWRADRMVTAGEYGGEALDSYESMLDYGTAVTPPPRDADQLFGHVQVRKQDGRQIFGFRGRKPANLDEYIEASQNYQADILAEITKGFRLSARRIAGYMQFHFIDALPANWPKAIVSHDLRAKRGYFAMAQVNQPIVPLPQIADGGRAATIWVANDLGMSLPGATVTWTVHREGRKVASGRVTADVEPYNAVSCGTMDYSSVPEDTVTVDLTLVLQDRQGRTLSRYQQEIYVAGWNGPAKGGR